MAAQTNYSYSTPKGNPGEKYDISYDEVITRKNEEEDGVLKYGMAAQIGTAAGIGVKVPTTGATADDIEGIVLRAADTEQDMKGRVIVPNGVAVGILKKGKVWGRLATGTTPSYGKPAYVVIGGDEAGYFTASKDGNVDIGAKFGNASDDGIAVIEIR
jgi:hypothetical protein